MKRSIGFALFWMGFGIFLTLFLPEETMFLRILLSAILMLCGFQSFSSC